MGEEAFSCFLGGITSAIKKDKKERKMKEKIIKLENGEELKMREPNVRVLKNATNKGEKEMEQTICMIAALTNKQESEIEDLNLKDFKALQDALKDFLVEAGVIA